MNDISAVSGCSHSCHLFAAPLCESQPHWKRIANVIFHIFTLAIPLLIYSFLCCSAANPTPIEENEPQNLTKAFNPITQIGEPEPKDLGLAGLGRGSISAQAFGFELPDPKGPSFSRPDKSQKAIENSTSPNLSPLQNAALKQAYELLQENPTTIPFTFLSNYNSPVYGPLNPDISRMTQLYCHILDDFPLVAGADIDSQVFLKIRDDLMKLAFAISYLTLKELPAYIEARAGGNGFAQLIPKPSIACKRTPAATIDSQDGYVNCTIRRCHIVYSYLRGACQWSQEHEKVMLIPDVAKERQDLFYQVGTLQNSWRELHNEFCQLFSDSLSDNKSRVMFHQDLVDSPLDPLFAGNPPPDRWNILPVIDQKS